MSDPVEQVSGWMLAWAKLPGPSTLLAVVRSRLERGKLGRQAVINQSWTSAQRKEIGRMLDAAWAGSDDDLSVKRLRQGLAHNGTTLEALLVALGGPLRDIPAERRARAVERGADKAEGLAILRRLLPNSPSVDDAALARCLSDAPSQTARATTIAQVIAALPPPGQAIRLPVLAANVTGDAHGLDQSTPLGRAVARLLALRSPDQLNPNSDALTTSEGWRAAWANVWVACDTVSARVLVLNLPLVGPAPAARLCAATPGEPVWLSLRSLDGGFALARPCDVYVCENPSIVEAAADHLGEKCLPVICTYGRPDLAALTLLRAIEPQATLYVRADGDAAGWSIVRGLLDLLPSASRWKMPDGMTEYEEQLVDDLIADLTP